MFFYLLSLITFFVLFFTDDLTLLLSK